MLMMIMDVLGWCGTALYYDLLWLWYKISGRTSNGFLFMVTILDSAGIGGRGGWRPYSNGYGIRTMKVIFITFGNGC
jgi:hypothetical protein